MDHLDDVKNRSEFSLYLDDIVEYDAFRDAPAPDSPDVKTEKKAAQEIDVKFSTELVAKPVDDEKKRASIQKKAEGAIKRYCASAYEGVAFEPFKKLIAISVKSVYNANPKEGFQLYTCFFSLAGDRTALKDYWQEALVLDDPEHAVRFLQNNIAKNNREIRDGAETHFDPLNTDRDLSALILKDSAERLIFTDTKGNGYEWNEPQKLWQEMEVLHASRVVCEMLKKMLSRKKIVFGDPKDEKKFLVNIGSLSKGMNIAKCLASRRLEGVVLEPNHHMYYLPITDEKNTKRVLDLEKLASYPRESGTFFTECTGRHFIQSPQQKVLIKRFKKLCNDITVENQHDEELDTLLGKIYPHAHRFISTSVPVLGKRTWFLHRLGISLTTNVEDRAGYWLYGVGSGGKTKILEAVAIAVGRTFASTVPRGSLCRRGKEISNPAQHTAHLVPFVGPRLCIHNETERGSHLDASLYKVVTDGTDISVRDLHKSFSQKKVWGKVFTCTQYPPIIDQNDHAVRDRVQAMHMNVRFWLVSQPYKPENWDDEKYQDFHDTLKDIYWVKRTSETDAFCRAMSVPEEKGGYLNELFSYCVLCAHRAIKIITNPLLGRLPVPLEIKKETEEFFSASDVVKDFINENCQVVRILLFLSLNCV